uniref:Uncharacterized protein n=1 Tax=Glossina palpalis gambiensis TaxID=67801 RepID=A0A1B0AZE8_9MUSC
MYTSALFKLECGNVLSVVSLLPIPVIKCFAVAAVVVGGGGGGISVVFGTFSLLLFSASNTFEEVTNTYIT